MRAKRRRMRPGEPDPIEEAMYAPDPPPPPLMPDEQARAILADPEKHCFAMPPGFFRWIHAQPGGRELYYGWTERRWRACDKALALKRGEVFIEAAWHCDVRKSLGPWNEREQKYGGQTQTEA